MNDHKISNYSDYKTLVQILKLRRFSNSECMASTVGYQKSSGRFFLNK